LKTSFNEWADPPVNQMAKLVKNNETLLCTCKLCKSNGMVPWINNYWSSQLNSTLKTLSKKEWWCITETSFHWLCVCPKPKWMKICRVIHAFLLQGLCDIICLSKIFGLWSLLLSASETGMFKNLDWCYSMKIKQWGTATECFLIVEFNDHLWLSIYLVSLCTTQCSHLSRGWLGLWCLQQGIGMD
jgi:hypothetical protein